MAVTAALGDEREMTVSQGVVRVRERGEGPPIVFLHGVLVNGDLWREVAPPLADAGFRTIVPDLPLGAHRPAMRADADLSPPAIARMVAELIEALALEDVTLVGNDTGGAFCQIVVANHPDRIGRLVLTNCDAYERFFPPVLRPLQAIPRLPGGMAALVASLRPKPAQLALLATVAKRRPEPELLEATFAPLFEDAGVRRDAAKVLSGVSKRHTLAAAERFREFRKPVLVAWGEDDKLFFPLSLGERLCGAFPDARLERIPGSRTFVPFDRPDALVPLVREFARAPAAELPSAAGRDDEQRPVGRMDERSRDAAE